MRRRNVSSQIAEVTSSRHLEKLRHLDVYAKVQDEYLQTSDAGGIVTVITSLIIALLLYSELIEFCRVEVFDTISVDTRLRQKLPIHLNITFPQLQCDHVSVDSVDSSGDNQVNVHGSLWKTDLTLDEQAIDSYNDTAQEIDYDTTYSYYDGECHSCYDAEDEEHKCCNTCDDLKAAYEAKGLDPSDTALKQQCIRERSVGCRVEGSVVVKKVSGNVHVALGHSTIRNGKHLHEFTLEDIEGGFNTSHEIHSIAFGEVVPGMRSPLDGSTKIVRMGAYMFHYYIKLVPTVFRHLDGVEIYTHQYAVTDSARNVRLQSGGLSGLPGVFIVYDFNPFLMRKTEKAKPWSYIFTSVSAIVGGVFSIAKLVEMVVQRGVARMFLRACV